MRNGRDTAADAMQELRTRGMGGIKVLNVFVCIALKKAIHDVGKNCCVVGLYSMG